MFSEKEVQLPLAVCFHGFWARDGMYRNGCSGGCPLLGLWGLQLSGLPHAQVIPDLINNEPLKIQQTSTFLLQSANTFWPSCKVTEERASILTWRLRCSIGVQF